MIKKLLQDLDLIKKDEAPKVETIVTINTTQSIPQTTPVTNEVKRKDYSSHFEGKLSTKVVDFFKLKQALVAITDEKVKYTSIISALSIQNITEDILINEFNETLEKINHEIEVICLEVDKAIEESKLSFNVKQKDNSEKILKLKEELVTLEKHLKEEQEVFETSTKGLLEKREGFKHDGLLLGEKLKQEILKIKNK